MPPTNLATLQYRPNQCIHFANFGEITESIVSEMRQADISVLELDFENKIDWPDIFPLYTKAIGLQPSFEVSHWQHIYELFFESEVLLKSKGVVFVLKNCRRLFRENPEFAGESVSFSNFLHDGIYSKVQVPIHTVFVWDKAKGD